MMDIGLSQKCRPENRSICFSSEPAKFEMNLGSQISHEFFGNPPKKETLIIYFPKKNQALWNWDEGRNTCRLAGILSSSNLLVGAVPVRWGKYLKMLASKEWSNEPKLKEKRQLVHLGSKHPESQQLQHVPRSAYPQVPNFLKDFEAEAKKEASFCIVGEVLEVNLNLISISSSRTIEANQWCWAPDYERWCLSCFIPICSWCMTRQLKQGLHVENPLEEVQLSRPWPGCHQKNAWRRGGNLRENRWKTLRRLAEGIVLGSI